MAKAYGYVAGRPTGLQVVEDLEEVLVDELPDENHPEVNASILGDSPEPAPVEEPTSETVAEEPPAEEAPAE